MLQKVNHSLKSERNTAGFRVRMLCAALHPLYSEAGDILRSTARAHEAVDMLDD